MGYIHAHPNKRNFRKQERIGVRLSHWSYVTIMFKILQMIYVKQKTTLVKFVCSVQEVIFSVIKVESERNNMIENPPPFPKKCFTAKSPATIILANL